MMLRVAILLLAVCVAGCSSFGYHSLEGELSKQKDARENAVRLKQHYDTGERFYQEGKLEQAEKEFKAMLELKSEEENALYRLGTLSFKQAKYDASAEYFERAIKVNPRNGKAHYNLASIRLMQAENHYKYYAALAGKEQDLSNVTGLLGDIDEFNNNGKPDGKSASLDKIAGALKK